VIVPLLGAGLACAQSQPLLQEDADATKVDKDVLAKGGCNAWEKKTG
jgi:hypothetical protein